MAKDYFQDIIPPAPSTGRKRVTSSKARPELEDHEEEIRQPRKIVTHTHDTDHEHEPAQDDYENDEDEYEDDDEQEDATDHPADESDQLRQEVGLRGIRNINIPSRRPRPSSDSRPSQYPGTPVRPTRSRSSRIWMWIIAGVLVLVLILLGIVAMRPTTISLVPRSHAVVFDSSSQFVAYAAGSSATGTLTYVVDTIDIEDVEIIPATGGTQRVETKSSGTFTVYNDYSTSPVRLIATTRFETPDKLIFRTPNDIVVPGKKGTTPGSVSVTLIADQAGEQYNIATNVQLSVPGLQKSADMFKGVTARSTAAITGGFVGDKAATDPAARATAIANMRTRMQEAAVKRAQVDAGTEAVIFPSLMQMTFQDLPDTNEANGVGVHQRLRALVPAISTRQLAQTVGSSVVADAENADVRIVTGDGFTAQSMDTAAVSLGNQPINFGLAGNATIIWNVDTDSLVKAVAGKNQDSFEAIIANFPSVQSAHARIEPFWKGTFPADPARIKVNLTDPSQANKSANQ